MKKHHNNKISLMQVLARVTGALIFLSAPSGSAATYTVTSLQDDASSPPIGSLRAALIAANSDTEADTINFGVNGVINLASALPDITDSAGLTITGAGHDVVINGGGNFRIFALSAYGQASIDSLVLENGFTSDRGAAIYNQGSLTVSNCLFLNNVDQGEAGGAIYSTTSFWVSNSTFTNNSSTNGGGALACGNNDTSIIVNITDSTFTNNNAGNSGGALWMFGPGTMTITGSTFSGNYVAATNGSGGAITNSATLNIINSTLYDNYAYGSSSQGGGIVNSESGVITILNSTLSDNYATSGGGIYNNGGVVTLQNAIVAHSLMGNDCQGTVSAGADSIADDNTCGSATVVADALLGALQNNGGPTQTMALLFCSPAIDAGNNAYAAGLAYDQRGIGYPRISHGTIDAGAFEYQQCSLPWQPSSGFNAHKCP